MFKDIVLKALKEKNMSMAQFAEAIGVSASAVYAWLDNSYKPKADKLLEISKVLDIPLEKLIRALEVQQWSC